MLIVSGMLIMTSDSRRIRGGKRRRQHQSGRAKRESRNSKSAKSHRDVPFRLATQRAAETPLSLQIDWRYSRTRSKTITISRVLSMPQLSTPEIAKKALKLKFRVEGFQL